MKKGFTLLETLVAIFILTIAITATLNAAQRNPSVAPHLDGGQRLIGVPACDLNTQR